ncbi:MAG: outer membrane beta-barrel protein [Luteitalea sp.]|nr:outer membrane beta-barrel protein [Luteitalea sp.]
MTFQSDGVRPWLGRIGLLMLLCPLLAPRAAAQTPVEGYVYAGPGGYSGFSNDSWLVSLGGGAEIFPSAAPLSVGVELGYLGQPTALSGGLALFSANGGYHFARRGGRQTVSPFVTAGYTRLFRPDVGFNAWNLGAGINYRVSERVGLRIELRDHIRPDDRSTIQYWTVRFGVTFL